MTPPRELPLAAMPGDEVSQALPKVQQCATHRQSLAVSWERSALCTWELRTDSKGEFGGKVSAQYGYAGHKQKARANSNAKCLRK
jgi:hypothetical protein